MDAFQDRLVRLALGVLDDYGFALAGGSALQVHGLVDRPSEDVDLFTDRWDPDAFATAVATVRGVYEQAGLEVALLRQAETFARMRVSDHRTEQSGLVDLAADQRDHQTVRVLDVQVIAEPDAVATKVATVFSRGAARDYIDLAGILASRRYGREELLVLGAQADGGFTRGYFAQALAGVGRLSDDDFTPYGLDGQEIAQMRKTMHSWSVDLLQAQAGCPSPPHSLATVQSDYSAASRSGEAYSDSMDDTPPPVLRLRSVVFDCPEPERLAGFYAALFAVSEADVVLDPEWSEVRLADPVVKLAFQRAERYAPPQWPSGVPQQVHLDVMVDDLADASARARALGSVVLSEPTDDDNCVFQVHADPVGHPFCFCRERRAALTAADQDGPPPG
ncbi:MAG: nucleotidyl transferase AbiEii/AbiGii toxin family protein [Acidimicrobiales bacterium]